MQFGTILIIFALVATLFSGWQYFSLIQLANPRKNGKPKQPVNNPQSYKLARSGFYAMAALVSAASILLMYLLLSHQFQVEYVYRYSSRSLPLGYLVSTFWAGQEGSFLLWALLIALMGLIFTKTARQFEAVAMLVVNVVQGFFLAILIKASPFALLPQTPADGAGLNPLLQDPWMVIHPPMLFIGYAAVTFPFALAVAALARRAYKEFIAQALPWTLFASLTLGAGIIIGGYWAYKVLGWGGYWGWDPVENSSLIPWLTVLALLHGLLVQKITGSLVKTNFFLSIVTFVLVIYATFLTRSGVLADFSVHSFQDLGINLYLILFMLASLGIGFGMFFRRRQEIKAPPIKFNELNRESIILASLFVFAVSAVLTFLGTSSPIFTGLVGNPAQVDISFYNKVHLPIGILMALILGFAPFLRWRNRHDQLLKQLFPSLMLTVFSSALVIFLGMRDPMLILFVATACFAFWSNLIVFFTMLRISWITSGAPLSHIGVGMLLAAIVISSYFEQNERVVLQRDVAQQVMNYQMTYEGFTSAENGKDIVNININSSGSSYLAHPRFYYSGYNQSLMREPDVRANFLYDLYISPLEHRKGEQADHGSHLRLTKGEKQRVGDYEVYFVGFEMANHGEPGMVRVGAHLEISDGTDTYKVVPGVIYGQNRQEAEAGQFPLKNRGENATASVSLHGLNADEKMIELHFEGLGTDGQSAEAAPDQLLLEVSRKPFMSVLWLGSILIMAGSLIAFKRRLDEQKQAAQAQFPKEAPRKDKAKAAV